MKSTTVPQLPSVELTLPASTEYTQIVRLVVSGIGNAMGLNLEEIEDLKLAVGEACYNAFTGETGHDDQLTIRATAEGRKLVVDIQQQAGQPSRLQATTDTTQKNLGLMLMKHLVDTVECRTGPAGEEIRLVKQCSGDRPVEE